MSMADLCLIRSRGPSGEPVVRLGMALVDDYLEFLEGRCRSNTVLAAAYDLRIFFTVVAKPPAEVVPADVLGFITAQRTGRTSERVLQPAEEPRGIPCRLANRPRTVALDHAVNRPFRVASRLDPVPIFQIYIWGR